MTTSAELTGFLDAVANYVDGKLASLTKGTNLFGENQLDDQDRVSGQVVLYDEGHEQVPAMRHPHLNWNVGIATRGDSALLASEALRPVVAALVGGKRFTAQSDAGEKYQVITVRNVSSAQPIERLDSGQFLARAVVQLEVIPVS